MMNMQESLYALQRLNESVSFTSKDSRRINKIIMDFFGNKYWRKPVEIRELWEILQQNGIDDFMFTNMNCTGADDGGKSYSSEFTYNGEYVPNHRIVYQVHEEDGEENEYNVYIS